MSERNELVAATGASGFIAQGILHWCSNVGLDCRGVSRSMRSTGPTQSLEWANVPSYTDQAAMDRALDGATTVLHLADNPHRRQARGSGELLHSSIAVITAARRAGVRQIILASSIYARDAPASDIYAASKRAAETAFLAAVDLNPVVLRLPPVYGPRSKGGLTTLAALVRRGLPLPLGRAQAERAYLSIDNLASLIATLVQLNAAGQARVAGHILEPSDGEPVTTSRLVGIMGEVMGKPARLIPLPLPLLRAVGNAIGKGELISGAIDSLAVAPVSEIEMLTDWRPLERMPESLSYLRES